MRTKNSAKTFIYGVILTTIIAILGLIKTKVLLQYLGDDSVGIYQLFFQIFTFISLIDGGLTVGITYYLYKPISDKNYEQVNRILAGAKSYFNKIGIAIAIIGVIISFNILFFIKETELSSFYIQICFIVFILASITSYFISSRVILYGAEQRLYKSSNTNHIMTIVKTILEIVLAKLGVKLLGLLIMFFVLTILRNIGIILMSKKDHKFLNFKVEKDTTFKKETKPLVIRKVNQLIFENTDIIMISKFLGLFSVVVYTVYFQIINMITLIIKRLNSALLASVGNLLVSDNEKSSDIFDEINSLLFFIASIICIPLYFMLSPFIEIWFGDKYLASSIVSVLFIVLLYVNIIKIVLEVFVDASGNFQSVKNASIYQSITNILLSLILINYLGIAGVLIATVFTFITGNFIVYPRVVSKKVINRKIRDYYFNCLKLMIGIIPNVLILILLFNQMSNNGLIDWFINGTILFIINFILTYGYYRLINELKFINRFKFLVTSFKKR